MVIILREWESNSVWAIHYRNKYYRDVDAKKPQGCEPFRSSAITICNERRHRSLGRAGSFIFLVCCWLVGSTFTLMGRLCLIGQRGILVVTNFVLSSIIVVPKFCETRNDIILSSTFILPTVQKLSDLHGTNQTRVIEKSMQCE
jgi:hypothetical protein